MKIKPSAEALGLALTDLASQVRAGFYGVEAQRIQRGREEVKVMIRYPQQERESMGNLESMYIRTKEGDEVPFTAVAELENRVSPSTIRRTSGQRAVIISADINTTITQPGKIVEDVTQGEFSQQLIQRYPAVSIELGGASQEEEELIQRMIFTTALALFAIYALMAIPLKSYLQPIIIMAVIPFGMIGALIGHVIVGIPFSALSVYGIIALAGVVVNNAIVLIDYTNLIRARKRVELGLEPTDHLPFEHIRPAIIEGGKTRLRPVLLTAITTVLGLFPLAVGLNIDFIGFMSTYDANIYVGGDNPVFWGPMSYTIIFGLTFATFLTLIVVPVMYLFLAKKKYQWVWREKAQ